MTTERERRFVGPRRGQIIFALGFFLVSALLLGLIGSETQWIDGTKLFAQPRFWPAVGLLAMVVMGGAHLALLPWRRLERSDALEAWKWAQALEFAGWFMVYVLVVPRLGYLPTTMLFVPLLAWRMGYRDRKMLSIALGLGIAIVVLFKMFLSVKIPGGASYELLPDHLRSFFILNL